MSQFTFHTLNDFQFNFAAPGIPSPAIHGCSQPVTHVTSEIHRSFFPVREQYWLDCLKKHLETNILFLCGADHLINSFPKLLGENQIAYEILINDFDEYKEVISSEVIST